MNKKLLVNEWYKTYSIIKVDKECFNNSQEIENAGTLTGFKIHSQDNLNFRVNELKQKGFIKEV